MVPSYLGCAVSIHMERRKFILGIGATSAAGAAAFGTGAFSSVEASRDVTVEVAGDGDAYLVIEPGDAANAADEDNGQYAAIGGDGQFFLDFTDDNGNVGGDGFNPEAVTGVEDVFVVQNQGTNPIELSLDYEMEEDTGSASIALQPDIDDDALLLLLPTDEPVDESVELEPGDEQTFSVIGSASDSIQDEPQIEQNNVIFTAEVV